MQINQQQYTLENSKCNQQMFLMQYADKSAAIHISQLLRIHNNDYDIVAPYMYLLVSDVNVGTL